MMTVPEAAQKADIVMILINDERQADMYKQDIAPYLTEGKAIAFAHGFNIRYQQIVPPAGVDVFMAAPKGPGHTVRSTYVVGKGVPCLVAVEQNASGHCLDTALAYIAGPPPPPSSLDPFARLSWCIFTVCPRVYAGISPLRRRPEGFAVALWTASHPHLSLLALSRCILVSVPFVFPSSKTTKHNTILKHGGVGAEGFQRASATMRTRLAPPAEAARVCTPQTL